MLGDIFSEILTLSEAGLDIDIEETGKTFAENAFIKAKTVRDLAGLAALADDSGLEVEALDGAPGVYSARYAGEDQNDKNNIKKLLRVLDGQKNRKASFTTVLCLAYPSGEVVYAEGKTEGVILEEEQGENGFGYDPIFFSSDLNKSFGQATDEEKNSVSHRGRALKALLQKTSI